VSTRSPHAYAFGPFRLVPEERLLLRDSQGIHLTPKAFDTLVVLVQNSGRLLPKRELLELIWPDSVVEENNLTQAICAIRKSLGGTGHSAEYIETVPKQGYRFVAPIRMTDRELAGMATVVAALPVRAGTGSGLPVLLGVLGLCLVAGAVLGLRQGWWDTFGMVRQSGARAGVVERAQTVSIPAYWEYVYGLGAMNRRSDATLRAAVYYFERAVEQDPDYASAYAALAECYTLLGLYDAPAQEVLPKAKRAALRALALDSTSAAAHTALAGVLAFYEWDWPGAQREFRRALELDPSYPLAHHWYGVAYWVPKGRFDEAWAQVARARQLDRQSLIIQTDLGWLDYLGRAYDSAIAEYDSVLQRDAGFVPAHYFLFLAYEQKAWYRQAFAELYRNRALNTGTAPLSPRVQVADLKTYRAAVRSLVGPDSGLGQSQGALYGTAATYMRLGEPDRALLWLQRAYRQRDPALIYLLADPVFDALHADARFQDLARRIGLNRS